MSGRRIVGLAIAIASIVIVWELYRIPWRALRSLVRTLDWSLRQVSGENPRV